jgi:hypothetical protein
MSSVLDMHMPGRGIEVARTIRLPRIQRTRPAHAPTIAHGCGQRDLREDSFDAGVDLFLSSPLIRALLRGVNWAFSQADGTLDARPPGGESPESKRSTSTRSCFKIWQLANDS